MNWQAIDRGTTGLIYAYVASPPKYARFECTSGTTFSIEKYSAAIVESQVTIYFEVPDVDAEVVRAAS